MNTTNWITILIGGLVTVVPQMISALPPPYRDVATAVIGVIVAAWHLYRPSPSSSK